MARRPDASHQLPASSPEAAGLHPRFRGKGARVPGWHACEVNEALIHFAGAKEAVREVAADLRAAAGDPALAEQRHLELLAAALYGQVRGGAAELAQAVRFVRHAAALVAIGEEPARPPSPLSVVPAPPIRPGDAAGGSA